MSSYLKDVLKIETAIADVGGVVASAPVSEDAASPEFSDKQMSLPGDVSNTLRSMQAAHNKSVAADASRLATSKALTAVYRRGATAYNAIKRVDMSRHAWAMSRVGAFLALLASGRPSNVAYTADNDLLPATHPKSPLRNSDDKLYAAAAVNRAITAAATVKLPVAEMYQSPEHAIFALAEYSGLGYNAIPSIRAAWMRAVDAHEDPFERAFKLAANLYSSQDADLLPKRLEDN
jgi:hypothetical protein